MSLVSTIGGASGVIAAISTFGFYLESSSTGRVPHPPQAEFHTPRSEGSGGGIWRYFKMGAGLLSFCPGLGWKNHHRNSGKVMTEGISI